MLSQDKTRWARFGLTIAIQDKMAMARIVGPECADRRLEELTSQDARPDWFPATRWDELRKTQVAMCRNPRPRA